MSRLRNGPDPIEIDAFHLELNQFLAKNIDKFDVALITAVMVDITAKLVGACRAAGHGEIADLFIETFAKRQARVST